MKIRLIFLVQAQRGRGPPCQSLTALASAKGLVLRMPWVEPDFPILVDHGRWADSPVAHTRVAIEVCSHGDSPGSPGSATLGNSTFVVATLNCSTLLPFHVLRTTDLSGRHDGRHPAIFNLLLDEASPLLTNHERRAVDQMWHRLGWIVCELLTKPYPPFHIPSVQLRCDAGRHRSLGVACAFAMILHAMGFVVCLYYWDPQEGRRGSRLCHEICCDRVAGAHRYMVSADDVEYRLNLIGYGVWEFLRSVAADTCSSDQLDLLADLETWTDHWKLDEGNTSL